MTKKYDELERIHKKTESELKGAQETLEAIQTTHEEEKNALYQELEKMDERVKRVGNGHVQTKKLLEAEIDRLTKDLATVREENTKLKAYKKPTQGKKNICCPCARD